MSRPPAHPLNIQVGGDHYRTMVIQPIEFIVKNKIPFVEGNCIKYLTRWTRKGGIQDLYKTRHYIDILIAEAEALEKQNEQRPKYAANNDWPH